MLWTEFHKGILKIRIFTLITVYKASLGHYWTLSMGVITGNCVIERMAEKKLSTGQGKRDIYSESVSPYQEADYNFSAFSVFDIKMLARCTTEIF